MVEIVRHQALSRVDPRHVTFIGDAQKDLPYRARFYIRNLNGPARRGSKSFFRGRQRNLLALSDRWRRAGFRQLTNYKLDRDRLDMGSVPLENAILAGTAEAGHSPFQVWKHTERQQSGIRRAQVNAVTLEVQFRRGDYQAIAPLQAGLPKVAGLLAREHHDSRHVPAFGAEFDSRAQARRNIADQHPASLVPDFGLWSRDGHAGLFMKNKLRSDARPGEKQHGLGIVQLAQRLGCGVFQDRAVN